MAQASKSAVLLRIEAFIQMIHGYHVDGGPGQPGPLSRDMAHLVAGGLIRDLAGHIGAPRQAAATRRLGLDLAKQGSAGLVQGYDGNGPPWIDYPFPWPLPWPPKTFDPRISIFEGLKPATLDPLLAAAAQRLADTVGRLPAPAA